MARGAPDHSNVRGTAQFARIDDLGEVIARMGFPPSIDREGKAVIVETWSQGMGSVETRDNGLGSTITLSNQNSRYGGFTLDLSKVANANAYAGFSLYAPIVETGKVGLEVQFCAADVTPDIKVYIGRYTGTQHILWGLLWDGGEQKVYIGGDTEGWEEVASGYYITIDNPHYHNIKLVVDVANEDYERIFIDGKAIEPVTKSPKITANANTPHLVVTMYSASDPSGASHVYVDYVIVTRDEY